MPTMVPRGGVVEADAPPQTDRDSTTFTCHLGNNLGPGRWQLQALVDDQVQGEALFTIKAECDPSVDPQDYERLARDDGIDDAPSDEARR